MGERDGESLSNVHGRPKSPREQRLLLQSQTTSRFLKAAKTGSLCCVAARPHGSTVSDDGWSAAPDEPNRRNNSNLSNPLSAQWENKSLREDVAVVKNPANLQRSPSSSGRGSQNGRIGSSHFQVHQCSPSESNFSNSGSPCDSFWAPNRSNLASLPNSISAASELNTSPPVTAFDAMEAFPSTSHSTVSSGTPESVSPHHFSADLFTARSRSQPSSSRHTVSGHSFFPKRAQPSSNHPLSRQISDSRIHAINAGHCNSLPLSERRHSCRWTGSSGESTMGSAASGASDWWSMHTFSDLIASSRRERLKWTDASSPSDFGWVSTQDTLVAERICASGSEVNFLQCRTDPQKCGVCSRLLTQKSPWGSQRMMGANDLSVVGVLVCGHVYHADCLEQTTAESEIADPPCPQCGPAGRKGLVESVKENRGKGGLKTNVSHGQASTRNKLSRIGIATDDIIEPEFSFQSSRFPSGKEHVQTEGPGGKSICQSSGSGREKNLLSLALPKRQFSFKGKSLKDLTVGDLGWRKPVVWPQAPEISGAADMSVVNHTKKARSTSLRYLKRW